MFYRRKKENIFKKIFTHKILISLMGLVLIILISIPLAKNASKRYEINQEISKLNEEIESMAKKNKELGGLINYLESDEFVAEQAKLNLNYKEAGEEVLVIKDKEAENAIIEDNVQNSPYDIKKPALSPKKETSNPRKWLDYFFKI